MTSVKKYLSDGHPYYLSENIVGANYYRHDKDKSKRVTLKCLKVLY
jgi:hypothetical protein